MTNPYLNVNVCYQLPRPSPHAVEVSSLPDNWLEALVNKLLELLPTMHELKYSQTLRHKILNEHTAESYRHHQLLKDSLAVIYYHLCIDSDRTLAKDNHVAIAVKLAEGVLTCTPGFHARANDIVMAWQAGTTLVDWLYKLRTSLVEQAAIKASDDVHVHNRFFIVAQQRGYGVGARNPHDPYAANHGTSALADSDIFEQLTLVFKAHYTPITVLKYLTDTVRTKLSNELDYRGYCLGGYVFDVYEKWFTQVLNPLLKFEGIQADFLCLDEAGSVVDIHWQAITYGVLQQLCKDNYLTLSEGLRAQLAYFFNENAETENLNEFGLLAEFLSDEQGWGTFLSMLSTTSLEKKWLLPSYVLSKAATPNEQVSFLAQLYFLTPDSALKEKVKKEYQAFVQNGLSMPADVNFETLANPNLPQAELLTLLFVYLGLDETAKVTRVRQKSAFILAALRYPLAADVILPALSQLANDAQGQLSVAPHKATIFSLVSEIADKKSSQQSLTVVMVLMKLLTDAEKGELLTQVSPNGNTLLLSALRAHPAITGELLAIIQMLDIEFQKKVLSQVDSTGRHALLIAANQPSEAIYQLIGLIKTLPRTTQQHIFLQVDPTGVNSLMELMWNRYPAKDDEEDCIFNCLNIIETFEVSIQQQIFTQTDNEGWNPLVVGFYHAPDAVFRMLLIVEKLEEVALVKIFEGGSNEGNLLMSAIENQPEVMLKLLSMIERLSRTAQIRILTFNDSDENNILTVLRPDQAEINLKIIELIANFPTEVQQQILIFADEYAYNGLLTAIHGQSPLALEVFNGLLAIIKRFPLHVQQQILTQCNDKGANALMLAAAHQPNAVSPLLALIEHFPLHVQQQIFFQATIKFERMLYSATNFTTRWGMNALMLTLRHTCLAVPQMLGMINKFSPEVQQQILTQVSRDDANALIYAVHYQSEAALQLLVMIKEFSPEVQQQILTQVSRDGSNALMVAVRHHREAALQLLGMIKEFPSEVQQQILTQVSSGGLNALMLALHYHSKAARLLLVMIKSLPHEAHQQILTQVSSDGLNALMYAEWYQPEVVWQFLELIKHLPIELRQQILTQKSNDGVSAMRDNVLLLPEEVATMRQLLQRDFNHPYQLVSPPVTRVQSSSAVSASIVKQTGVKRTAEIISHDSEPSVKRIQAELSDHTLHRVMTCSASSVTPLSQKRANESSEKRINDTHNRFILFQSPSADRIVDGSKRIRISSEEDNTLENGANIGPG